MWTVQSIDNGNKIAKTIINGSTANNHSTTPTTNQSTPNTQSTTTAPTNPLRQTCHQPQPGRPHVQVSHLSIHGLKRGCCISSPFDRFTKSRHEKKGHLAYFRHRGAALAAIARDKPFRCNRTRMLSNGISASLYYMHVLRGMVSYLKRTATGASKSPSEIGGVILMLTNTPTHLWFSTRGVTHALLGITRHKPATNHSVRWNLQSPTQ